MKISITGNTKGIGQAISNILEQNEYEVFGFNRSNDYNIDSKTDRLKIVYDIINNESEIFINNAYGSDTFSQLYMLYDICSEINKTNINHIININSVNHNNMTPKGMNQSLYIISKNALSMASEHMNHLYDVYITNLYVGLTDTQYNKHKTEPKLRPEQVGEYIHSIILSDFKIKNATIML